MLSLTDNDLELLSLVVDGLTTEEIAEKLDRSPHTIKSRKSRIIRKLSAANMNEAVFVSVHEIARWRRKNVAPDDSVGSSPWLAKQGG